jgi:hypothetical protein
LTNFRFSAKQNALWVRGEIPRADVAAGRGAEGETPIGRGKLSGKRTVIHCIPWRELIVRPPKGKAQPPGERVISQVKGQGSLGIIPKLPCFSLAGLIMVLELGCIRIEEIEVGRNTMVRRHFSALNGKTLLGNTGDSQEV